VGGYAILDIFEMSKIDFSPHGFLKISRFRKFITMLGRKIKIHQKKLPTTIFFIKIKNYLGDFYVTIL